MTDDEDDFESIAVGSTGDRAEDGDVVTPIHRFSTDELDAAGSPEEGHTYARHGTPTRAALEARLAALSNADHALAAASGMAAISESLVRVSVGLEIPDDVLADLDRALAPL